MDGFANDRNPRRSLSRDASFGQLSQPDLADRLNDIRGQLRGVDIALARPERFDRTAGIFETFIPAVYGQRAPPAGVHVGMGRFGSRGRYFDTATEAGILEVAEQAHDLVDQLITGRSRWTGKSARVDLVNERLFEERQLPPSLQGGSMPDSDVVFQDLQCPTSSSVRSDGRFLLSDTRVCVRSVAQVLGASWVRLEEVRTDSFPPQPGVKLLAQHATSLGSSRGAVTFQPYAHADGETDALGMPTEDMRKLGYWVVDRVVEHFEFGADGPAVRTGDAAALRASLGGPVPMAPSDPQVALQTLVDVALSHMQHGDHPRYFARVPGPSSFAGFSGTGWLRASTQSPPAGAAGPGRQRWS